MQDAFDWMAPHAGLALALALGLLVGIERGWAQRRDAEGARVAGVRTFALLGLCGGIAGEAAQRLTPIIAAVILLLSGGAMLIGYARSSRRGDVSATTTIVGVITMGVGLLASTGQLVSACMLAAVTLLLLSERRQLHAWVAGLTETELHAMARFGLVALAVLPVLPDRQLGPLDAWNPRQIWMVVVLVCGLSLLGYAAGKRFGSSRGLLVTAATGAIVSSTAVTAALAARIRKSEGAEGVLIAGISIASAIMLLRVMILVAALIPFALPTFALVAAPAALVSAGFGLSALRRSMSSRARDVAPARLRNPFDLRPALILAGLVMLLSLAGRWALERFGDMGLATVLGISGMVDVDAAIVTMSGLPHGAIDPVTAGYVLAAPVLANSVLKAGLTIVVGRRAAAWRAAAPLIASVVAGGAGAALTPAFFP